MATQLKTTFPSLSGAKYYHVIKRWAIPGSEKGCRQTQGHTFKWRVMGGGGRERMEEMPCFSSPSFCCLEQGLIWDHAGKGNTLGMVMQQNRRCSSPWQLLSYQPALLNYVRKKLNFFLVYATIFESLLWQLNLYPNQYALFIPCQQKTVQVWSVKVHRLIKKQRQYFANKGPSSQAYGFSSSHIWTIKLTAK